MRERTRGCWGRGLCVMTVVSFQANATFDALGRLRELVELWDELGPRVWDFFQDGPQVEALRVSTRRGRAPLSVLSNAVKESPGI